jgi:16S rRNA G966 N2-methylase RsmD
MTENAFQPSLVSESESELRPSPEEAARKAEYRERLHEYLKTSELRALPGFPIADDDAILGLSDPPHYTACPNPFLSEIIEVWQKERLETRKKLGLSDDSVIDYHREPFAADVSEGKNDPIYSGFSYHTKVPHKAIMHYIRHYTEPGDLVLDGFSGTGMTGVAAQLCGADDNPDKSRKAILVDLSPAATSIAYSYNLAFPIQEFTKAAKLFIHNLKKDLMWLYEVERESLFGKQIVDYVIWSEVFYCPNCLSEYPFSQVGFDFEAKSPRDNLTCPECGVEMGPNDLERALETSGKTKVKPVRVKYLSKKRVKEMDISKADLEILEEVEIASIPYKYPNELMMDLDNNDDGWGDMWRRGYHSGMERVSDFYHKRTLWVLAAALEHLENLEVSSSIKHLLRSVIVNLSTSMTKMRRAYQGVLPLVLYIPKLQREVNVIINLERKLERLQKILHHFPNKKNHIVTTQSSTSLSQIPDNSIDYVFIDPPFGDNIIYSEVNFLQEALLKVKTAQNSEAIMSRHQRKGIPEYQDLMTSSFMEFNRVLKPGRWVTVEFHNSKNVVWNSIQEALQAAKFVVADVRVLDKIQGSFKQVSTTQAVKLDLVISLYKPTNEFENTFSRNAGSKDAVWSFVRQHLAQLPVVVEKDTKIEISAERQEFLLFDRMVAFHVQRGASIPLSAGEFYLGLRQRYAERDGMFFLPDQTPEYDRARLAADDVEQLSLFVNDEKSAIQWIRQLLNPKQGGIPQTYQEIQPVFLKQLRQQKHEALPELADLLEENFLENDAGQWYFPDPAKASDLEKLRQKSLLREFKTYTEGKKRLRHFRTEAVRAGFAETYKEKNWQIILQVAERLPVKILQEDPDLLMYYDAATLRAE